MLLVKALQLLGNPASGPRRSRHKCSCCGRERSLSLRTSSYACRVWARPFSFLFNLASTPSPSSHKDSHCGREERLPTCLSLCLSGLGSRFSFLLNPASAPRSSSHKQILYGRRTFPPNICLMLVAPNQWPQLFIL